MNKENAPLKQSTGRDAMQDKQSTPSSSHSSPHFSPRSSRILAAVLIRSGINFRTGVKETLSRLNLHDKLNCVLVPDTPVYRGMLQKVDGVTAWGPLSSALVEKVKMRRSRSQRAYRLHPPRGGFERKGIKISYRVGGALGKRPSMDSLIQRML